MNKNDDLVNGRWSNKFYVAIDYNFCSFTQKYRNYIEALSGSEEIILPGFLSCWRKSVCNMMMLHLVQ